MLVTTRTTTRGRYQVEALIEFRSMLGVDAITVCKSYDDCAHEDEAMAKFRHEHRHCLNIEFRDVRPV